MKEEIRIYTFKDKLMYKLIKQWMNKWIHEYAKTWILSEKF